MTEASATEQSARRAALFGPASGRHRILQPISRHPEVGKPVIVSVDLATAPAMLAADRALLEAGTPDQVEQQVIAILAASRQRTADELRAGELARDGSLALDSMSAVFVCRIVARVLGPSQWQSLRGNCEPKDFVSVRSLASLITRLRRGVAVA